MKIFTTMIRNQKSVARDDERGYLIVVAVVVATVLIGLSTALAGIVSSKYAKTAENNTVVNTIYAAEAGISDTIARLNAEAYFAGYPESARKVLYSSAERGRAEYATSIVDNGNNTVTITSNGYYYHQHTALSTSNPTQKRTIRVVAQRTEIPIKDNIVAGAGGLAVQSWSAGSVPWWGQDSGMSGSVYSRGKISLSAGFSSATALLGSATTSVNVTAGNIGCGNSSNWPQPCGSSSPPLQFSGGRIYGTVCATDQISSANIFPGPTGSGLIADCVAPPYKKPKFDKAGHVAAMTVSRTGASASCSSGTITYAPNTVINGNVTISGTTGWFGSSCTVNIEGDVYIKGSLTLTKGAKIVVANSVGTRKPKIVVNGKVDLAPEGTSAGVFANSQGTPVAIVGFWSTDNGASGCSNSDSCTELSPAHAYHSAYRDSESQMNLWNYLMGDANVAIAVRGDEDAKYGGLMAYSFFGITRYTKSGVTDIYGLGGEGVFINACESIFPVSCVFSSSGMRAIGVAPYEGVLHYDQYSILDYQQVF